MRGDAPEFMEATRLALKFFPESRGYISLETGLDWDAFLGAMMTADYDADYSCYPFHESTDPNRGLASMGGLDGRGEEVYSRLICLSGISPQGRAVVILEAIKRDERCVDECFPFVCDSSKVPERLKEIQCFGSGLDSIFVFESGAAILVDHDDRVHWSRSRLRRWTPESL